MQRVPTTRLSARAIAALSDGHQPAPWRFSARSIAVRLFFTCWLIFAMHLATNTVRELFPMMSLGDRLSFRVDEFAHMHPDLFDKAGYGWHINNNPGVSMVAAVPYALCRPVTDRIIQRVNQRRAAGGLVEPPAFDSPWPMAREFFAEAWQRGFDVKFGLAAIVAQTLCMAPSSALGVVAMFYLLRRVFGSDRTGFWLAVLYAFGTPVFLRTGQLNQNLMLGHIAFLGFLAMWNPSGSQRWTTRQRYVLGGLAGGAALLFDYSGVVMLLGLFFYGLARRMREASSADALRHGGWYILGTLGPVGLLWFYQWQSFGHPFLPGQHWMAPVQWIEFGYRGFAPPQLELIVMLAFDSRFGLFVTCPLMLLALAAPFIRAADRRLPMLEMVFMLLIFAALWMFLSCNNYSRLQYNCGIRHMTPILPFLFVPAAVVLMRLPRAMVCLGAVAAITESWCLAMHRDVERGLGVLDPVLHVFLGGFELPILTTLARTGTTYGKFFANGVSPLPIFALASALLAVLWMWHPWRREVSSHIASNG